VVAYDEGRHPIAREAAGAGFGAVDQLGMVNVATQVEALTRHPLVAGRHRRGEIEVIGVFYDIASAIPLRIEPESINDMAMSVT
jgi:carbonic anhydrase